MRAPVFAVFAFFLVGAVLLVAAPAAAQEVEGSNADAVGELPRPGFWEGGGVRVTEGTVFHPSVEIASGYQNNVFFQDTDDGPSGPMGAALARITVGATLGSVSVERLEAEAPGGGPAGQRLAFDISALVSWVEFLSSEQAVKDQSDLGISLNGGVKFNPAGKLSFEVRDGFVRSVSPGQSLREDLDRDRNELNARLTFKPGGGAIETYLAYTFVLDVFESSVLLEQDRMSHFGAIGGKWHWLPKTELNLEANIGTVTPSDTTTKSESTPFRATLGVSSLLTPVFGFILKGGYGNGLYARGENVSTWLAVAEVRLAIGPTLRTAVGYTHDFADALVGNFYVDHQFFVRGGWQVLERLQLRALGELRLRSYGGIVDTARVDFCGDATCANTRSDVLARVEVGSEYQIRPWLLAGISYSLTADSTDFFVRTVDGVDSGAFTAHELLARVSARF